jgi:hypothetical protein
VQLTHWEVAEVDDSRVPPLSTEPFGAEYTRDIRERIEAVVGKPLRKLGRDYLLPDDRRIIMNRSKRHPRGIAWLGLPKRLKEDDIWILVFDGKHLVFPKAKFILDRSGSSRHSGDGRAEPILRVKEDGSYVLQVTADSPEISLDDRIDAYHELLYQPSDTSEQRTEFIGRRLGGFLRPFRDRADTNYIANVDGGSALRDRAHETLVNSFARWLTARGFLVASNAAIDLGLEQPPVIIEAKKIRAGRWAPAIREAIGQLYEYRYFQVVAPESELIFLVSTEVPAHWLGYLDQDREIGAAWPTADGFHLSDRAWRILGD